MRSLFFVLIIVAAVMIVLGLVVPAVNWLITLGVLIALASIGLSVLQSMREKP
jgi:hypothetical protein